MQSLLLTFSSRFFFQCKKSEEFLSCFQFEIFYLKIKVMKKMFTTFCTYIFVGKHEPDRNECLFCMISSLIYSGADAIIRQHKAACLRVTSLLICKDLLWIGTSAGVILTNPLPSITASTSVLRHSIGPTGSPHGHTGHVRFLTSVEVPKATFKTSADYDSKDNTRISPSTSNRIKRKDLLDKQKSLEIPDNSGTVTLVVSGGDGYEDFRYNQQSEAVGRDDSTNHLLIWRV